MLSGTAIQDPKFNTVFYGIVLSYVAAAALSVAFEFFYIFLLPLMVLLAVVAIYRLDYIMLFCALITPFSINLTKTGFGIGMSLPSEPLMFGLMLIFLFKLIHDRGMDARVVYHPVSLAILFHLAWMFLTSLTSSMLVVSLKATLARICFVLVFFYFGTQLFRDVGKIKQFVWAYLIPLLGVIAYTTVNHAAAGFTVKAAHTAMVPFYNDHTAYAAVVAMFVPLLIGMTGDKTSQPLSRSFAFLVLIVLITAIVLSYTRASWVSLVAALICYLIFVFRIHTYVVVGSIVIIVSLLFIFESDITMALEKNRKESSTELATHIQSVSNITTDASNVERINRWYSAMRMFNEKPFFGWGPGTYSFQYAPFQKWNERTIISTNFGEGGNAHSEYIGPLAEQGVLGMLAFVMVALTVIYRGSRIIISSKDPHLRMLAKGLVLGLITYLVHGMLNNFLDTEKASVPFWGFIGALVALEVYHLKKENKSGDSSASFNAPASADSGT